MQSQPTRPSGTELRVRSAKPHLELLLDPDALDQTDDLEYLLSLCGEALRREGSADSAAMAEWVVDEWCRVVEHDPAERTPTDETPGSDG